MKFASVVKELHTTDNFAAGGVSLAVLVGSGASRSADAVLQCSFVMNMSTVQGHDDSATAAGTVTALQSTLFEGHASTLHVIEPSPFGSHCEVSTHWAVV